MRKVGLLALLASLAVASPAGASTVISSAGDADCFGLGGSCPPGTLWRDGLGGVFFTSNATAGDPAFTDAWNTFTAVSYDLPYGGGGGSNLAIELLIAGIADDNRGPWTVFLNGSAIGQLTTNNDVNAFQEVRLFDFLIDPALLSANNVVSFTADGGDGFSVDYVALVAPGVPEPSTWAMMIMGLGAAGVALRRRRHRRPDKAIA